MSENRKNFINSINLNADSAFPYLMINVFNDFSSPMNPGFQVMHWHEDIQFIYVLDGEIEIMTLNTNIQACAGDGVFINKNVVHHVKGNNTCHYNSFIFPDYFLKFYLGSPAGDFVESVVGKDQLPVYHFAKETASCKAVLSILQKLSVLEKNKTEFYIYEVLVLLSTLWLEMRKGILLPSEKQNSIACKRVYKFLQYIDQHYGEEITLDALAKSANVSKSECLRCFKLSLQTTPYKYLVAYRLSKAAEMLRNTEEPVGIIAEKTGFRQTSHFGKCFKEKTGFSPSDYRKKNRVQINL